MPDETPIEELLKHMMQDVVKAEAEHERRRAALLQRVADVTLTVLAENKRLRVAAEREIANVYRMWHACGLRKAERGIPAGTLCDDCLEAIAAHVKAIKGEEGK